MVDQDGFCAECGATAPSIASFCAECGQRLDAPRFEKVDLTRSPNVIRTHGVDPASGRTMVLKDGNWGPYVTDGEYNASLKRGDSIDELTEERAAELLAERRKRGPSGKGPEPTSRMGSVSLGWEEVRRLEGRRSNGNLSQDEFDLLSRPLLKTLGRQAFERLRVILTTADTPELFEYARIEFGDCLVGSGWKQFTEEQLAELVRLRDELKDSEVAKEYGRLWPERHAAFAAADKEIAAELEREGEGWITIPYRPIGEVDAGSDELLSFFQQFDPTAPFFQFPLHPPEPDPPLEDDLDE